MISWSLAALLVEWSIRLVMLTALVVRPHRPSITIAWMAFIMVMPWLGVLVYVLFGGTRLGFTRARRYARDVHPRVTADRPGVHRPHVIRPKLDEHQRSLVNVAETFVGLPILGGNQVEFLADNEQYISRLIADIDGAVHHAHLLFFIIEDDETGARVCDALVRAAARGVSCRVLADAAGSFSFFRRRADQLRARGVEVYANLPVSLLRRQFARVDLRNHRKLVVIDGRTAYTGSHNLVRAQFGPRRRGQWKDLTARIEGPSVTQLQAVFYEDWHFETGQSLDVTGLFPDPKTPGRVPIQVVPSGPSQSSSVMRDIVIEALHSARRRVVITTPYFVPDDALQTALKLASARGARVELVIPRRTDHPLVDLAGRYYYEELLAAGVSIYLNRGGVLHAKTMTVDDCFAMIGSANFDIRSFFLNFELNLLLYEPSATAQLRFCQTHYIEESAELTAKSWERRPVAQRLMQNCAMLLSPLL